MTKRVLIVEDEIDVADLIGGVLDLEGYETRLAVGETAMDAALSFHPDLVLLDLMMPVVDGFTFLIERRKLPDCASIPVLVLTAVHDLSELVGTLGVKAAIAKPFEASALIESVALLVAADR